jgi:hypothetical protein
VVLISPLVALRLARIIGILRRGGWNCAALLGGHSYGHAPFRAAGLEGHFDVTFSSMGYSYAGQPILFDAAAAVLALCARFEEAS